ncbi:MAG: cysteine desulfurase [Clostridia bacterium]|nr:cysteine desulfurase [Clostridia bacterium]
MIYADFAATTPLDPDVWEVMKPYALSVFGNASSTHACGRAAASAVEEARQTVASLLRVEKREVFFTSGGTESDNWAIRGVMKRHGGRLAVSAVEHHAVLNVARALEREGTDVCYLPVDGCGRLDPDETETVLQKGVTLLSLMAANNEVGTIEPIEQAAELAHAHGALFFTDAVQAACLPALADCKFDLLSLSAHKFFGPKGVGALIIREGTGIENLTFGGSQEGDRRPGTLNTAGIVGMAAAFEKHFKERIARENVTRERADVIRRAVCALPGAQLLGDENNRLPGLLAFRFEGLQAESLAVLLDMAGVAVSAGAACSAGAPTPSHVMRAMGMDENALRISVCHLTTQEEAETIARTVTEVVRRSRKMTDVPRDK